VGEPPKSHKDQGILYNNHPKEPSEKEVKKNYDGMLMLFEAWGPKPGPSGKMRSSDPDGK